METQTYFGIEWDAKDASINYQDISARIFLCPGLTPQHVTPIKEKILTSPINGFIQNTDHQIFEMEYKKESQIRELLNKKHEEWVKAFGELTTDDYDYLKTTYPLLYNIWKGMKDVNQPTCKNAKEMAEYVKKHVKGQDHVIEKLAVPFFMHNISKQREIPCRIKQAPLLIGQTGVGKSEILRQFARICSCPIIRVNTSEIVPSSWKGMHLSDVIAQNMSKYSLDELRYSVIVFNEIDKITGFGKKNIADSGTNFEQDYCREIMRLFESENPLRIQRDVFGNSFCELPTEDFLIVFDGAFYGMPDIVKKRLHLGNSFGFGKIQPVTDEDFLQYVNHSDLESWGFPSEFVSRIGNILSLKPLSEETIYNIMTTAQGNIMQEHINFCKDSFNINLKFEQEAIHKIAATAQEMQLGFRSVKKLLAETLATFYYTICGETADQQEESRTYTITKEYITEHLKQR